MGMAIDTAEEADFQSCDISLLSGMDAFAFGYEVEWPVSLVLNHKALAQYQMLFRHFFYCKHIERLLSAVWITNKQSNFLNSCLHDCLLSSPQLLATVKKLLNVCSDFAHYMQNLTDATEDFVEDIKRYDLQFNSVLASLLDRISQLGRDNYNEKVLNILHRLDFNGFYTTAIDQFKSTPGILM